MLKYPPNIRKVLNDLSNKAYDVELGKFLDELFLQFGTWKQGEIDADQMHEYIHEYHKGPSRQVYAKYNNSTPDVLTAQAIVQGYIDEKEVPAEVMEVLKELIAEFKAVIV